MVTIAKKLLAGLTITGVLIGVSGGVVSAHVVVKPAEVETASFQTFTTGVPSEGENATTKLRVVMPSDLKYVTPTVKPGWTIETLKEGEGENATIKEITWNGGEVPAGQRDEFSFSAQVPENASTLQWKAYQTYSDGSVVAWDQAPSGKDDDDGGPKPYSTTKVVDSLVKPDAAATAEKKDANDSTLTLSLSVIAFVFSIYSLTAQRRTAKGLTMPAAKTTEKSKKH